ncbi:LON peptidase substrate-binding domain-containing protein [Shewanella sp. 0m-8]
MKLPLFPLQICILPGGFTQLRIFEPRYLRLVKESLLDNSGFGACMLDIDNKTLLPLGTLCKIVDFETLEGGLLGVTIKGIKRFELGTYVIEADGLKKGQVTLLPSWHSQPVEEQQKKYTTILKEILTEYPEHLRHYKNENFNDLTWVCQRWLEILPLPLADKQYCIAAKDHLLALSMINDVIK